MVAWVKFDRFREFGTAVELSKSIQSAPYGQTYIASLNFFSAKSLLPSAFSASAMIANCELREFFAECEAGSCNFEEESIQYFQATASL